MTTAALMPGKVPGMSPEAMAFLPRYKAWRHGGWYVNGVRYPSGACGCVSRNYPDRRWRIVCDARRGAELGTAGDHTYGSRDEAARAEFDLVREMGAERIAGKRTDD